MRAYHSRCATPQMENKKGEGSNNKIISFGKHVRISLGNHQTKQQHCCLIWCPTENEAKPTTIIAMVRKRKHGKHFVHNPNMGNVERFGKLEWLWKWIRFKSFQAIIGFENKLA